jgi:co-chaperonin GroES (HSP10)
MIQSPENKIIVSVTSKYSKDFGLLAKRMALQDGTSIHLEDFVNIVGTVVSLPVSVSKDGHYKDFSIDEIKVGDTILFSFSVIYDFYQKEDKTVYKNRISYKAKEYWLADITKVFGIIRGDNLLMINGYVMAKAFQEDVIFTQPAHKKLKKSKSSELLYIGTPRVGMKKINAKSGDIIHYNPRKAQKYQIENKPFIILNQHQILGKSEYAKVN